MTRRFKPKLFEALRGYNRGRFFKDLGAGLTVSVVALPLSMAFAIASGLKPEAGLVTAIVGGLLISALPKKTCPSTRRGGRGPGHHTT
jgi:SulP family sulfate permease